MKWAILSALLCVILHAQGPPKDHYIDAEILEVVALPHGSYLYTVLAGRDRYTCTSSAHLQLTEGSKVKMAETKKFLWIVAKDGKPQRTRLLLQELVPPPPPVPEKIVTHNEWDTTVGFQITWDARSRYLAQAARHCTQGRPQKPGNHERIGVTRI
jgi:hypothetical protein